MNIIRRPLMVFLQQMIVHILRPAEACHFRHLHHDTLPIFSFSSCPLTCSRSSSMALIFPVSVPVPLLMDATTNLITAQASIWSFFSAITLSLGMVCASFLLNVFIHRVPGKSPGGYTTYTFKHNFRLYLGSRKWHDTHRNKKLWISPRSAA